MVMDMKMLLAVFVFVLVVSVALGVHFYSSMPEKMASHWNIKGEVDGHINKFWGLFLFPVVSTGIFLLFLLIPFIDPLKKNINKFKKYYEGLIIAVLLFLFYVYLVSLLWNLGYRFNMGTALTPIMGILFYYLGIVIENSKRNWFIGIRTPWTLSSDEVWNKTHKLGGRLFKLSGLFAVSAILFPNQAFYLVLIPILVFSAFLIIYSYFMYKIEKNPEKQARVK